ncbi:MAG TPA: glycosyltransferase family 39 protein [Xanthobacteraceae bacterium]|nr:glycosyltransferase family 39 protein [Xanthobacteraceae bacterium]
MPEIFAAVRRSAPTPTAALIRWAERRPGAAFGMFLVLHFTVWTILPALLYANLPLDLIEALVYGREWQLGYDKLPPLPWWLIEAVHRAFGADIAYYATAQTAVLIAFALVFALSRRLVGAVSALVGILIIDGLHYFQYTAVKFNHDVIQLPFWALAGYAFHAALRRSGLGSWTLLGFAVGGAVWAKYFVIVLALPYALFMLFDRQARRAWATPGPWLSLLVALLVASPHILWLFQSDFLPFAYASHRAAPIRGWFDHVLHPSVFLGSQIFFLLPSLFVAAALFWPREAKKSSIDPFDRRIVTLLAFGPALTIIALTAVTGRGAVAMWGYPLWLFLGLWLVMAARVSLDTARLTRTVGAWAVVFTIFVVAFVANYLVLPYFDHRYRAALFPGDRLGAALTARFHEATGAPLRYVIGTMWDGGNLAHYSPDQPEVLIDGLPRRAPWIDLDDLHDKGAMLVWTQSDPRQVPAAFAAIAPSAEIGTPFNLPMRRNDGVVHVGWAILKPR